jgi:hypothetical protein
MNVETPKFVNSYNKFPSLFSQLIHMKFATTKLCFQTCNNLKFHLLKTINVQGTSSLFKHSRCNDHCFYHLQAFETQSIWDFKTLKHLLAINFWGRGSSLGDLPCWMIVIWHSTLIDITFKPCLKEWACCMERAMVYPYVMNFITSQSLHDLKGLGLRC